MEPPNVSSDPCAGLGVRLQFPLTLFPHLGSTFKHSPGCRPKLHTSQQNKSRGELTFGVQAAAVACPALESDCVTQEV